MDWRAFNLEAWRRLPREFRTEVVTVLREKILNDEDVALIREKANYDPDWLASYHHFWGRWVRNQLRSNGFHDEKLPPTPYPQGGEYKNWDDYYGAVVEVAVRGGIWFQLAEDERA